VSTACFHFFSIFLVGKRELFESIKQQQQRDCLPCLFCRSNMIALTMNERPPPPPAQTKKLSSSRAAVEIVSLALGLLESDENDLALDPKQSFDSLDSSSSSSSSKLPPLDQVTTCSDDSSSVSSLSSAEDDSFSAVPPPPSFSSSPPRSIFKTYWDKTGVSSPPLVIKRLHRSRPTTTAVAPPVSRVLFTDNKDRVNKKIVPEEDLTEEEDDDVQVDCGSGDSVNTYERTLKRHNHVVSSSPGPAAPSPHRRSIFGQQEQLLHSQPNLSSLSSFCSSNAAFRKTQSTSALVPSLAALLPSRSCLRQGRFSSSGRSSSWCGSASHYSHSSFTSNVSFQEDVRVVVYQRPVEHWAADGWSQRFA